ncbi:TIGR02206 family membrane protein [Sporosarcina sp. USHLN248]|uniref:YwaF family protein n=1 Tax=Sporosarcina sp. USHLN248 TaxID=3081300 RepID=UPI00301AB0E5
MDKSGFILFSATHIGAILFFIAVVIALFIGRNQLRQYGEKLKYAERTAACILLLLELLYHLWMAVTGRWSLADSLPLELCSISLLVAIVLLWSGNRHVIDFVLFAGIGGAVQALLTPVLDIDFPHFRFFHFFLTHIGIILTGLYFVWVKGYVPTLKGVFKAFLLLNALVPLIFIINLVVDGNYMFLREKPYSGSLLDYLGPYPLYIVSLEVVAILTFLFIYLLLRIGESAERKRSSVE